MICVYDEWSYIEVYIYIYIYPTLCCLKVDMSNAFNNCHCECFLQRLHQELPELYGWVQWCYHTAGELRFGRHKLQSTTGVQQGDPLGPLLFSLVILELLDDIGPFPNLNFQLWYLDDGTLVGPRNVVASIFEMLQERGPSFGLHVNIGKCEVYWPSGDQSFPVFHPDIQRVGLSEGGIEFLGSPVFGIF